ncbi:MAG: hypothetical protein E7341_01310 [Clostridiales bacterium]|nr:hypothetical protein [Clostridiales bacterium]
MQRKISQITAKNTQLDGELKSYINLLGEEQKIKFWIKTLLSVHNNIPEVIKAVDKIIEIQASSISFITDIYNTEKSTLSQVEKVIDLSERKNNLLNIYLISQHLFSSVGDDERLFLERKFIFNWTADELATEYNVSSRTIFRKTEKLIDKIYLSTKRKNWTLKFITLQVKNETWLNEKFKKLVKDYYLSTKKLS